MTLAPVTFTRIDADHYVVGQIVLTRIGTYQGGMWAALPPGEDRPLFTAVTLEEILGLAHHAVEMMRPA